MFKKTGLQAMGYNMVREWNKLPPLLVQCDTLNTLKNKLDCNLLNHGIREELTT